MIVYCLGFSYDVMCVCVRVVLCHVYLCAIFFQLCNFIKFIVFLFSVEELKRQYELLKLKRMLFEYGITDFNYSYSNLSIAWVS